MIPPLILEVDWAFGPRLARLIDLTEKGVVIRFLGCTINMTMDYDSVREPGLEAIERYNANPPLRHWNGEGWDDGIKARYGVV